MLCMVLPAAAAVPEAVNDAYDTDEDVQLVVTENSGVLRNDSDADFDVLTAVLVSDVSNGTLDLAADGSFTYQPDPEWSGIDSFVYGANDGTDQTVATVTIDVMITNDPPMVVDDAYDALQDTELVVKAADGLLVNDSDPEGDPLTVVLDDPPEGELDLNDDGSFRYQPKRIGEDSFTYRALDGEYNSVPATVTLVIADKNEPPVAEAQDVTTKGVLPVTITLDASDPENDELVFAVVEGPANGTLKGEPPEVTYTAAEDFTGSDSFVFEADDGEFVSEATVTITVNEPDVQGGCSCETSPSAPRFLQLFGRR